MLGESTLVGLSDKIKKIVYLCNNLAYVFLNEIQEVNQRYIPMHKKYASKLMCISIRSELNPNVLSRLTDDQITYIITFIRHKYSISLIGYGIAVGILAAQSVSEPMTQYMLDSHHRSVSGGTNKSGLIRVNEIYGAKGVSKEQSASMQLLIKLNYAKDIISAQLIGNVIEYVCFKNLIKRYDIILESHTELRYPPYKNDVHWMNECIETHLKISIPTDLTKWCYRIVINKTELILKAISLELIIRQLKIKYQQGIYILYTSESVEEIVIRIWVTSQQLGKSLDYELKAITFLNTLIECQIRGVKGIIRATAKEITRHKLLKNGKLVQEKRFVIETVGTNLSEVFLYAAIDPLNSISSSIGNTNEVLGIDAARSKIISETISFMQKDAPNIRHLSIYADELTRTGKYTNLEKSGVSLREPNNVLLKASFSSPIQVFQDAAINETTSHLDAISGKMLLGATPAIGTFYNTVAIDSEYIAKNTKSIDSVLDEL
jgi:DNA-directed RNA polymerase II subunit RPB1